MAYRDASGSGRLGRVRGLPAAGLATVYAAVVLHPGDGIREGAPAVPVTLLVSSTGALGTDVRVEVADVDTFATTVFASTLVDLADGVHTVTVSGLVDLTRYWLRVRAAETGTTGWTAWVVSTFVVDLDAGRAVAYVDLNAGPGPFGPVPGVGFVDLNVGAAFPGDDGAAVQFVDLNAGVFLVGDGVGYGYAAVGDVNTDQPFPRVWFLLPDRGARGDGINVYGWGFGDLPGTYSGRVEYFDPATGEWEPVPVVSWVTIAGGADAFTAGRVMDPTSGVVTMGHQVVGFTVPAGAIPPGYTVRVVTEEV